MPLRCAGLVVYPVRIQWISYQQASVMAGRTRERGEVHPGRVFRTVHVTSYDIHQHSVVRVFKGLRIPSYTRRAFEHACGWVYTHAVPVYEYGIDRSIILGRVQGGYQGVPVAGGICVMVVALISDVLIPNRRRGG